jgi:pimeloyl-ACP methyl ester carboxylesterase
MTRAPTVLLLHGLGATGAVWTNVCAILEQRVLSRLIAPDLAGHGTAAWRPHYSVGAMAAELAEDLRGSADVLVVGHSLGAYIALALASGWFGVRVRGILGLGPKILWTPAELTSAAELAARPVRSYATREEALARYRRVSGLDSHVAAAETSLARGVVTCPEGWRLAQDPRTFAVAGAPFQTLAASAQARVMLARGSEDQLVTMEQLTVHDAHAVEIPGAGHNVHVEKPEALVALLEPLL